MSVEVIVALPTLLTHTRTHFEPEKKTVKTLIRERTFQSRAQPSLSDAALRNIKRVDRPDITLLVITIADRFYIALISAL